MPFVSGKYFTKGQIKPKSRLERRRFSQKTHKQTNLICLPLGVRKQTKQIRLFVFWEKLCHSNLLSKLIDLYKWVFLLHLLLSKYDTNIIKILKWTQLGELHEWNLLFQCTCCFTIIFWKFNTKILYYNEEISLQNEGSYSI